jgi:hypothetical protein
MITNPVAYAAAVGMWLYADHKLNVASISTEVLTDEVSRGMEQSRSPRNTADMINHFNVKDFFRQSGKTYKPQHKSIHPATKAKAHIHPMSLDEI